jgi:hypothetical protein
MANPIKIPVSNTILTAYNVDKNIGLFDVANSQFCLQCDPSEIKHDPWKTRATHPGLLQTYVTVEVKNRVISVDTKDGRADIKNILDDIQSEVDDLFFPILDYHHPEKADVSQGYTIRQVVLKEISPVGGTFNLGNIGLGWRIVFEEDVRGLL